MRSAVKERYRLSPMRTVPIDFCYLERGRLNRASLLRLTSASFRHVTPGTIKQQVEKRFQELLARDPHLPRVVVIAPTLGRAPGEIIAAEAVGRPKRELVWLTEPSTGID
jgi:hypothetical protein